MPGTPIARLGLGRTARLKHRSDFVRARAQGQRTVAGCLIANVLAPAASAVSRLGVVTSKSVGPAVDRTRARRLLREVFRRHQHDFARPVEVVLVARPSIVGKKFAQVERDFLKAVGQTGALKHE